MKKWTSNNFRRLVFVLVLSLSSLSYCNSQNRFHIGTEGDYSILIHKDVVVKNNQKEDGGFIDEYILRVNGKFSFLLSVSKVITASSDRNIIYGDEFLNTFKNECNCKISDVQKVTYRNLDGRRFSFVAVVDGNEVKGYSVATNGSRGIYSINFITLANSFESKLPEFEAIMAHLVFR